MLKRGKSPSATSAGDALDALKKDQKAGELTEDDFKDEEKKLQDMTDKFVAKIDEASAKKEKELMEL